ncbi:unnamed protein product [Owenia fusiformis]|uniref:Uncharacterized protein n=1 Tax=Owenia fusiformis TaxID=6347 RepID=A0A8J1Y6V6_OWEFU|nr:unnamed protein product [Owenia fusiformis]
MLVMLGRRYTAFEKRTFVHPFTQRIYDRYGQSTYPVSIMKVEHCVYEWVQSILEEKIEILLSLLEENGANQIRSWTNIDELMQVVDITEVVVLLSNLKNNKHYRTKFVEKCLPKSCHTPRDSLVGAISQVWNAFMHSNPDPEISKPRETINAAINLAETMSERNLPVDEDDQRNIRRTLNSFAQLIFIEELTKVFIEQVRRISIRDRPRDRTDTGFEKDGGTIRTKIKLETLDEIMSKLEQYGANVRWLPKGCGLPDTFYESEAKIILEKLQQENSELGKRLVEEVLPIRCREGVHKDIEDAVNQGLKLAHKITLQKILLILKSNGAPRVQKWADADELIGLVSNFEANTLLDKLSNVVDFRKVFVHEILPEICRTEPQGIVSQGQECLAEDQSIKNAKIKDVVKRGFEYFSKDTFEKILKILENNGAPRIRMWAKISVLLENVEDSEATVLLSTLEEDCDFRTRFVHECLPSECHPPPTILGKMREYLFMMINLFVAMPSIPEATNSEIRNMIESGIKLAWGLKCVSGEHTITYSGNEASNILHGSESAIDLTNDRVSDLMKIVEPFIYGDTPLIKASHHAVRVFRRPQFQKHKKVLFIISDGEPADGKELPKELHELDVKIVCCFITNSADIHNPRCLYSVLPEDREWERAAKLMFKWSSTITTQDIPRTLFVKRGWTIDTTNNETRLFCQVNHPDIIDDVCDLVRNVVCCQDALSDVLSSVSLDLYINRANQGLAFKDSRLFTFANASSAVMHLAMKRIFSRDGGYPDYIELRNDILRKYEDSGAPSLDILKKTCAEYRLHCQQVDELGAMKAVSAKRPVLAMFKLTEVDWNAFTKFYKDRPRGILTRSDIDIRTHSSDDSLDEHAVVLTSYTSEYLRFMGSYGSDWADSGFFRVQEASVFDIKFVDVFWEEDDLTKSEIDAFAKNGASVATKLFDTLKGLNTADYTCPICEAVSKVIDFSGRLLNAKYPECSGTFDVNEAGSDIALNLYLTSLSSDQNEA